MTWSHRSVVRITVRPSGSLVDHIMQACPAVALVGGQYDGQREQYHLVRTAAFTPKPRHSWEQLNAEYVFELRWWTQGQLGEAAETFAPRRLPELVLDLVENGPPTTPIDAGV